MTGLYRLDETLWSSTTQNRLFVSTPGFDNRWLDYKLALITIARLNAVAATPALLISQGVDVKDEDLDTVFPETPLKMRWQVTDITLTWYQSHQSVGIFPSDILTLTNTPATVFQLSPWSYLSKIGGVFSRLLTSTPVDWATNHTKTNVDLNSLINKLLLEGAYRDSFTALATSSLQTAERFFVSEKTVKGSSYFVLEGQTLSLKPISIQPNQSAQDALLLFVSFLKRTFAWRIIDGNKKKIADTVANYGQIFEEPENREEQLFGYLKATFGIDLNKMITDRSVLIPDHVFKCNIAVNNIEMQQVQSLWIRIVKLKEFSPPKSISLLNHAVDLNNFLKSLGKNFFSLREIRGLFQFFKHRHGINSNDFLLSLKSLNYLPNHPDKQLRDLDPSTFNNLMEILFVDTGIDSSPYPSSFFSGRKIVHLGITGYKTMGDKNVFDPSRNLFELFHIFPDMRFSDERAGNELLSLVVSKKSLWSHYPYRKEEIDAALKKDPTQDSNQLAKKTKRRVGAILPYTSLEGQKRWYYVDGLLNDTRGYFGYVLVPASKGYLDGNTGYSDLGKREPLIKLFRSTASDLEAENSVDSLIADANPKGVGIISSAPSEYEMSYFSRCTMPLWIAYLINSDYQNAVKEFAKIKWIELPAEPSVATENKMRRIKKMIDFIEWQLPNTPSINSRKNRANLILEHFITQMGSDFIRYLSQSKAGAEWDQLKIAQDIHFVGHSLGGAQAQNCLCKFGSGQVRIPLRGCQYKCYAFDTPGVGAEVSGAFLDFGRTHRELLVKLGQKWEIHFQFDYKDIVPCAGTYFLGTKGIHNEKEISYQEQDTSWLTIEARYCKPLATASSLNIITTPTHGRRYQQARNGAQQPNNPDQPNKPDYVGIALTIAQLIQLKESFNPKGIAGEMGTSAFFGEKWRETFGTVAVVVLKGYKKISGENQPNQDELNKSGVEFVEYSPGLPLNYIDDPNPMLFASFEEKKSK